VLWSQGYQAVCGIDEVGRGAFAGPLVAAGVIYSPNTITNFQVNDSKLLSSKKRRELDRLIRALSIWVIVEVDVPTINKIGVGKACQLAYRRILSKLKYDFVLIDAFSIEGIDQRIQKAIIRGDQVSASIASASIIAKVYRDQLMAKLDLTYPEYQLASNKGYGTLSHRQAIARHGLSELHRRSFKISKYHEVL